MQGHLLFLFLKVLDRDSLKSKFLLFFRLSNNKKNSNFFYFFVFVILYSKNFLLMQFFFNKSYFFDVKDIRILIFLEYFFKFKFLWGKSSKFFSFMNKKGLLYNYDNFILRLDFFYLLFFGKYVEYFRKFKYNEYLKSFLDHSDKKSFYKFLNQKTYLRYSNFLNFRYILLKNKFYIGYSYKISKNYKFLNICLRDNLNNFVLKFKQIFNFGSSDVFIFCLYLFKSLYRIYILNLIYKNFMSFYKYKIFIRLRFFSLLNLFFFVRNFDLNLNFDFFLVFLKSLYIKINLLVWVYNSKLYTCIYFVNSLNLYKIINFYIFSYISDYYHEFLRIYDESFVNLTNLKFFLSWNSILGYLNFKLICLSVSDLNFKQNLNQIKFLLDSILWDVFNKPLLGNFFFDMILFKSFFCIDLYLNKSKYFFLHFYSLIFFKNYLKNLNFYIFSDFLYDFYIKFIFGNLNILDNFTSNCYCVINLCVVKQFKFLLLQFNKALQKFKFILYMREYSYMYLNDNYNFLKTSFMKRLNN